LNKLNIRILETKENEEEKSDQITIERPIKEEKKK